MNIVEWLKNIAGSFQPTADKIKMWKLTPQQQQLSDTIWLNLSPAIQKAAWGLVALILSKYGPDAAKAIWLSFLENIKREGWVVTGEI